jgi:hypothetical protein
MQSNLDQRIIFYDASVPSFLDCTVALNEWNNGKSLAFTFNTGDYLYISTFLPFNHKFFKLSVVSPLYKAPIVEVLNSPDEWSPVVDTLDYTAGMTASGVVQWTTDEEKGWGIISNSSAVNVPALTGGPVIYDSYWMRISFATATQITLEYIGQKFTSDVDLFQEYPMLQQPTLIAGWKTGKTNWDDQHLLAATYISKIMVQRGILFTNNQILDIASLRSAAVHKTAHIIYSGLGAKNYASEIQLASNSFETAMTQGHFQVDTNANARKDRQEVTRNSTSWATR